MRHGGEHGLLDQQRRLLGHLRPGNSRRSTTSPSTEPARAQALCGSSSNWSIASAVNLYNNTGTYVIAGGGSSAVDDGSHAYLQSTHWASVTGTIQAIVSAAAIGFQTLEPWHPHQQLLC